MEAWLAIEAQRRLEVCVDPPSASLVHAGVANSKDFDASPSDYPANVELDQLRAAADLPAVLLPAFDARRDRFTSTRLQSFSTPTATVKFRTLFGQGVVELGGIPLRVLASSQWRPLHLRNLAVAVVAFLSFVGAICVPTAYAGRHAWFARFGSTGLTFLLALDAGLFVTILASVLLLHPRALSVMRAVPAGFGMAATTLGTGLVFLMTGPTLARAEGALASNAVDDAEFEANALLDLGKQTAGAKNVLDQAHLHRVEGQPDPIAAAELTGRGWYSTAARAKALDITRQRTTAAVAIAYKKHDPTSLSALGVAMRSIDSDLAARTEALARLVRAQECALRSDFGCALPPLNDPYAPEAEKSETKMIVLGGLSSEFASALAKGTSKPKTTAEERSQFLAQALDLASTIKKLTGTEPAPGVDRLRPLQESAERQADLERKIAAQRRAQHERAAELRQKQQAAQEAAQERAAAWADQSLLCNDGTLSPSCTCGGSHRGCCSHHGGVAGCAQ